MRFITLVTLALAALTASALPVTPGGVKGVAAKVDPDLTGSKVTGGDLAQRSVVGEDVPPTGGATRDATKTAKTVVEKAKQEVKGVSKRNGAIDEDTIDKTKGEAKGAAKGAEVAGSGTNDLVTSADP